MNKRKILFLFFAVVLAMLSLATVAYAEDDLPPEDAVWEITHADGTKEYSADYNGGIRAALAGDTLRLMKDYVEVNDYISSVSLPGNVTIDIGSSTVVYTTSFSNDEAGSCMLGISSGSLVLRGDGGTIYLRPFTRSFIALSGNASLRLEGGEEFLNIYAPCCIDSSGSGDVVIDSVLSYKISSNMRALFCIRNSAEIKVTDSVFSSEQSRHIIYCAGTGKYEISSSALISIDNTALAKLESATAAVEFTGANYVYGKFVRDAGVLTFSTCTLLSNNVTEFIPSSMLDVSVSLTRSFLIPAVAADGRAELSARDFTFTHTAINKETIYPEKRSTSEVEIISSDGSIRGYSDDIRCIGKYLKSGETVRLLSSVAVEESILFKITNSLTLDLNGKSLILIAPEVNCSSVPMLAPYGSGNFNIVADGAIMKAENNSVFSSIALISVSLSLSDGYIFADDTIISGGAFSAKGGYINASVKAPLVMLNSTVIYDDDGATALVSGGSATVVSSKIISLNGIALNLTGTATVGSGSRIYGAIVAGEVSTDADSFFSNLSEELLGSGHLVERDIEETVIVYSPSGSSVAEEELALSFTYSVVAGGGSVRVSFTLTGATHLNVYIPEYLMGDDTIIRIKVSGLLASYDRGHGELAELNGVNYYVFNYPYIYHSDFLTDAVLRIVYPARENEISFNLLETYLKCVDAADEQYKPLLVSYLAYITEASYYSGREELLSTYADYLPTAYTGRSCEGLDSIISSVYFDAVNSSLILRGAKGVTLNSATLNWGGEQITLDGAGSRLDLLFYRAELRGSFTLDYTVDGENKTVEAGLLDLFGICDPDGYSTSVFSSFVSYLTVLYSTATGEDAPADPDTPDEPTDPDGPSAGGNDGTLWDGDEFLDTPIIPKP